MILWGSALTWRARIGLEGRGRWLDPSRSRLVKASPIGQQLEAVELPVKTAPYGIAVAKQDVGTRNALQSALLAVIADGTYDRILARWGLQDFALRTAGVNSGP